MDAPQSKTPRLHSAHFEERPSKVDNEDGKNKDQRILDQQMRPNAQQMPTTPSEHQDPKAEPEPRFLKM